MDILPLMEAIPILYFHFHFHFQCYFSFFHFYFFIFSLFDLYAPRYLVFIAMQ